MAEAEDPVIGVTPSKGAAAAALPGAVATAGTTSAQITGATKAGDPAASTQLTAEQLENQKLAEAWGLDVNDPFFREVLLKMMLWKKQVSKKKGDILGMKYEDGAGSDILLFRPPSGAGGEFIGIKRGLFGGKFSEGDAHAIMAAAHAKKWHAVDVHGKVEHKELMWLEAMKMGMMVNNFIPAADSAVAKTWYDMFNQWLATEAAAAPANVQTALLNLKAELEKNPNKFDVQKRLAIKLNWENAAADDKKGLTKEQVAHNTFFEIMKQIAPDMDLTTPQGSAAAQTAGTPAPAQQKQTPAQAPKAAWGTDPKKLVIVYHDNCMDGSSAAWTVMQKEGVEDDHPDLALIPYAHYLAAKGDDLIRAAVGPQSKVYFVDVAPKPAFLDELLLQNTASSVHVLDHHSTEVKAYKDYKKPEGSTTHLELDMDGSRLSQAKATYEKMFPNSKVPDLFKVIDWSDGAGTGLGNDEERHKAAAYLDTEADISTMKKASDFIKGELSSTFGEMAKKGDGIYKYQKQKIKKMLGRTQVCNLQMLPDRPDMKVLGVDAYVQEHGRMISSEVVEAAKKKGADVSMIWTEMPKPDGSVEVVVSLRSDGKNPNLGDVCDYMIKTTGCRGGGHGDAAVIYFSRDAFKKHVLDKMKPVSNSSNPGGPKP